MTLVSQRYSQVDNCLLLTPDPSPTPTPCLYLPAIFLGQAHSALLNYSHSTFVRGHCLCSNGLLKAMEPIEGAWLAKEALSLVWPVPLPGQAWCGQLMCHTSVALDASVLPSLLTLVHWRGLKLWGNPPPHTHTQLVSVRCLVTRARQQILFILKKN